MDKIGLQIFKFTMCQNPFRFDKLTAFAFIAVKHLATASILCARCFASSSVAELTLSSGFTVLKFSSSRIKRDFLRPGWHCSKSFVLQKVIDRVFDRVEGRVEGREIFIFSASYTIPSYRVKVILVGTSEGEEEGDKQDEKAHDTVRDYGCLLWDQQFYVKS
jgi:hypothetical protein